MTRCGPAATDGPEQELRLLDGHAGDTMVHSPSEARLLMEFWARHLALSSALEDDPTIVRVST